MHIIYRIECKVVGNFTQNSLKNSLNALTSIWKNYHLFCFWHFHYRVLHDLYQDISFKNGYDMYAEVFVFLTWSSFNPISQIFYYAENCVNLILHLLLRNKPYFISLCTVYVMKDIKIFTGWNLTFQSTEWWLNVGWMATEWWRERWISVAFQSPFSYHSFDWMAGTFQWPFSQLIFWKIKLRPTRIEPGM